MDKSLDIRLQMEALITEREGMIALNYLRDKRGESQAYSEEAFQGLITQFNQLVEINRS